MLEGLEGATLDTTIEQPPDDIEFFSTDGIFVKQMLMKSAGTLIPQHAHCHDHLSMLATGSVRVWKDGRLDRDHTAPAGIMIKKGVKHAFLSLEDNTIIYCVHNLHDMERVEIAATHELGVG